MAVKVGSFTKSIAAATASQAVTGVGFTPRALILWTVGATSTGAWNDGYMAGFGFTAGASSSGSISGASPDNLDTSNTSSRMAAKALTIVQGGESVLAECDLTSFDSDGFTLSWTINDANAYYIHYIALGGGDFSNATVLSWALSTSTGNQAVTGAGFQPDCVLHIAVSSSSALPLAVAGAKMSIGAMDTGGQWAHWNGAQDAAASSNVVHQSFANKALYGSDFNGINDYYVTYVSMDADGFTVNVVDAPGSAYKVFSLCLKGGSYDVNKASLSAVVSPPANQAITGVGFQPEGVMLLLHDTAVNAANHLSGTGIHWSIGAADGTTQGASIASEADNLPTTNTGGYTSTSKTAFVDSGSNLGLNDEAIIASLDADGFTLTKNPWPTAVDTLYFAFAGGSATSGRVGIYGSRPTMALPGGVRIVPQDAGGMNG